MTKVKVVHENLWCTLGRIEEHHKNEFPFLGNYIATSMLNPFPRGPKSEWCEISKTWGDDLCSINTRN